MVVIAFNRYTICQHLSGTLKASAPFSSERTACSSCFVLSWSHVFYSDYTNAAVLIWQRFIDVKMLHVTPTQVRKILPIPFVPVINKSHHSKDPKLSLIIFILPVGSYQPTPHTVLVKTCMLIEALIMDLCINSGRMFLSLVMEHMSTAQMIHSFHKSPKIDLFLMVC